MAPYNEELSSSEYQWFWGWEVTDGQLRSVGMQTSFNSLLIPSDLTLTRLVTRAPVGVNSKLSLNLVKFNSYLSTKTKEKQEETSHKSRLVQIERRQELWLVEVNAEDS